MWNVGVRFIEPQLAIKSHNFAGKDTLRLVIPSELESSQQLKIDFEYTLPIVKLEDDVMILDRGHRWYPLIIDEIARFKLIAKVPDEYAIRNRPA